MASIAGECKVENGLTWFFLQDCATGARLQLLEEVVTLVVHQDEGREVLNLYLPDGFHAQFGILYALDGLDVVLCQDGSRSADGAEVETAVSLAGVGHLL